MTPVACPSVLLEDPVVSPPDANISKLMSAELVVYSLSFLIVGGEPPKTL